jgi:hypothetical protein
LIRVDEVQRSVKFVVAFLNNVSVDHASFFDIVICSPLSANTDDINTFNLKANNKKEKRLSVTFCEDFVQESDTTLPVDDEPNKSSLRQSSSKSERSVASSDESVVSPDERSELIQSSDKSQQGGADRFVHSINETNRNHMEVEQLLLDLMDE